MYVCVKIELLNFEILHTCELSLVFFCVSPRFRLDDGSLDFGDGYSTVFALNAPGNDMNDVSSSWKMEVLL
jgi:hypothetical protein